MRHLNASRLVVGAALGAILLAACGPDPAPPPPPDPAPVVFVPALPPAPGGVGAAPLDASDAPDPSVISVDPSYCAPPPPPSTTTTTTTTSTTTSSTTTTTTVSGTATADESETSTPTTAPTTTTTTTTAPPAPPPAISAATTVEPAATACYFAYTTQVFLLVAPVWRSTDLVHWTIVGDNGVNGSAIHDIASWAAYGWHWAPQVIERPDNPATSRFVMWYAARQTASGQQCLGVATAALPTGPFVDSSGSPAYCQHSEGGTIDPSPFVDTDGSVYLTYKSEFPARLWVSRLTSDATSIVGGTEHLLLNGGAPDADTVEAPTMVRSDSGQVYLFYSTDGWWTADYRVGVARCDSPNGPCNRMYSTAVLGNRGAMVGPGGQTPFRDAVGAWHMLFHSWTYPSVGYPAGARSLHLLPLTMTSSSVQVG